MRRLKACFEKLGFKAVGTYINSGNVIFETTAKDRARLVKKIDAAIEKEFGLRAPVVVRTPSEIARVTKTAPKTWVTDQMMRCDVLFLWPDVDSRAVLKKVPARPDIEDLKYVPGALIWRIDRANVGKSKARKVIGSDLYKSLTIRNINTVRKLDQLLRA